MLTNTDIIFAFTVIHFSSDLLFKSELSEEIRRTKSNSYSKHFDNCEKTEHVGLYTVRTHHKKFGRKKKQIYFVECQGRHSVETYLTECSPGTLNKEVFKK